MNCVPAYLDYSKTRTQAVADAGNWTDWINYYNYIHTHKEANIHTGDKILCVPRHTYTQQHRQAQGCSTGVKSVVPAHIQLSSALYCMSFTDCQQSSTTVCLLCLVFKQTNIVEGYRHVHSSHPIMCWFEIGCYFACKLV